ncbi:MAG: cbb3-type cytochrome c oxidase subunit 3 [Spirochaetota bacterium]
MLELLILYKGLRLPLMGIAICYIIFYVYSKKRRARIEEPKYRMLEED